MLIYAAGGGLKVALKLDQILSLLLTAISGWTWVSRCLLKQRWWRWWWHLDYWSYKSCKAAVKSSSPANQHQFVYRPDALPVAQPTLSKHWRDRILLLCIICLLMLHVHCMLNGFGLMITLGASKAAAQCIVIGPVCAFVCAFVGVLPR